MLHISLRLRGRAAVGAFMTEQAYARVVEMRRSGQAGRVTAIDTRGRPFVVAVETLAEIPIVHGTGLDILPVPDEPDPHSGEPPRTGSPRCA